MRNKTKYIYGVIQNQDGEIEGEVIHAFPDYDEAVKCARMFNEMYGSTDVCEFTPEWDFYNLIRDCEYGYHYYVVCSIPINKTFEEFKKHFGY